MFGTHCKKIQNTKCVKRDQKLDVLYEKHVAVHAILIGKSETSEPKNKKIALLLGLAEFQGLQF